MLVAMALASVTAFAGKVCVPGVGDVEVSCGKLGSWTLATSCAAEADGAQVVTVRLSSPTAAVPPAFSVRTSVPVAGIASLWRPSSGHPRYDRNTPLPPWGETYESSLGIWSPVYDYIDVAGKSVLSLAASDPKRRVLFRTGVNENRSVCDCSFTFFADPEAPQTAAEVSVRFDAARQRADEAIRRATDWVVRASGADSASVPNAAFEPLYSTWYSYHRDLTERDVERECALASELGMKTLIVDDGWQQSVDYGGVGDWRLKPSFSTNMAAHVARVHSLGMKYMVWFSVPFLGKGASNYDRLKDRVLRGTIWRDVFVLDPRYPDVREYLIGVYERAVREWGLDGLKLDFIDWFSLYDVKTGKAWPDLAAARNYEGCDCRSVPEAVDRLMRDIRTRIEAVRPGALVEFRQTYMGPAMQQYGNMMRACDCPGDRVTNRRAIANLRLTSGKMAVHSDMLLWTLADTPESAAEFVLNSIFGTVQYSVRLGSLSPAHLKMVRHWVKFSREHLSALQRGEFAVDHPEGDCAVLRGETADERVIGVYEPGRVAELKTPKKTYVLNATGTDRVTARLPSAATVRLFDTFGELRGEENLSAGLHDLAVPRSGFAEVLPRETPPVAPDVASWHGANLLGLFNAAPLKPDKRIRGKYEECYFRWLRDWGLNFARLPMDYRYFMATNDWTKLKPEGLKMVDEAVAWGRKYGIHVQLCIHRAPGYTVFWWDPERQHLQTDAEPQDAFMRIWSEFARRYRGIPNSELSFNLVNEPTGFTEAQFIDVFGRTIDAIRKEDPGRFVMLDGNNTASTPVAHFYTVPLTGQAFRGYTPHAISHYKAWYVKQDLPTEPTWPFSGEMATKTAWNLEHPATTLVKFSEPLKAGYPVMIGEFGCYNVLKHETCLAWMEDCLKLWREKGLGWAIWNVDGYFGFIDSDRTDVEYEDFEGHKLDRKMLDLLRKYAQ